MVKTDGKKAISKIDILCKKYTNLSERDIDKIKEVSNGLQLMADVSKSYIFIDCLMRNGNHAIVVAEAAPATANSIYKKEVVGTIAFETFEPAVLYCLRTGNPMTSNRAITQEGKKVKQSVVPVIGEEGNVIGAFIMEKYINEKEELDYNMETFTKTTESLGSLFMGEADTQQPIVTELMEEALFFVGLKGELLYSNPSAINLLHEMEGESCRYGELLYERLPMIKNILFSREEVLIEEVERANKTFKIKKIHLPQDDKYNGIFIIIRDLTELREKEKQLVMKSVAIQEIHHRVKNNMQTVASLLRLQIRRGIPEESKVYFIESLNRILSIASVYEVILSNSHIDEVDIFELTQKIGDMLVSTDEREGAQVNILYFGEELTIDSDRAVAIALVINELIQNCINHAFPRDERGEIKVNFQRDNEFITIHVIDNGIGIEMDKTKVSLGLDIVRRMIVHDLSGKFTIKKITNGTEATFTFPAERRG